MKNRFVSALAILALSASFSVSAQPTQAVGDNSTGSLQNIGDVDNTKSSSTSTQVNPSANNVGNGLANNSDIRSQINPNIDTTINPNTTSQATGAILGNESKANASNGAQTTNASSTNDNKSTAAVGNSGNSAIKDSGNSAANSAVKDSGNATQGQQQANNGVNKSANNNSVTGGAQTQTTNGVNKSANNLTGGAQTLTGGAQNASTRSGVDNSGNVGLTVDASSTDNSRYDGRTLFIPAVIPQTPSSYVAAANLIKETTACGPLQRIRKTDVNGVDIGWFYNTTVKQGENYDIEDDFWYDTNGVEHSFREENIGGQIRYKGTQAIIFAAVVGTATAKNLGLGGGGSNMNWGQAGGGNSGSMQQIVTNVKIVSCFLPFERPILVQAQTRTETKPTPPQRDPCIVDRKPTKKNRATTMWVCAIEE